MTVCSWELLHGVVIVLVETVRLFLPELTRQTIWRSAPDAKPGLNKCGVQQYSGVVKCYEGMERGVRPLPTSWN